MYYVRIRPYVRQKSRFEKRVIISVSSRFSRRRDRIASDDHSLGRPREETGAHERECRRALCVRRASGALSDERMVPGNSAGPYDAVTRTYHRTVVVVLKHAAVIEFRVSSAQPVHEIKRALSTAIV